MSQEPAKIRLQDVAQEPYRALFPLGTIAAILGVLLWPLHFRGVVPFYPGIAHAHIMANAFFGAYIVGFLGTAFPRLISAPPLKPLELLALVAMHIVALILYSCDWVRAGDGVFLAMLGAFVCMMFPRFLMRKDLPPPAFVMVVAGLLCGIAGTALAVATFDPEIHAPLLTLQKLLSFQGFVLLPILGVAGFLIPRFFGMKSRDEFPEMTSPNREWWSQALIRAFAALAIVGSFFLEAWGWARFAPGLRFVVTLGFCLVEVPLFHRTPQKGNSFVLTLRLAFVFLAVGFGLAALFPGYRVAVLHTTFVGGFALITLVVATRVVFGHSGNLPALAGPNRWFLVPVFLITLGFLTRISGDLWPRTMENHYIYAAILWTGGVLIWGLRTVPKVLIKDVE